MIISASRRTDIPAFFSDWFYDRIKAGYVMVRNPFNGQQIRRISLSPPDVDCFVFWTKNPGPMMAGLDEIKVYPYYFLFTLNGYEKSIEKSLPPKSTLIDTFAQLADKLGKDRVIWRYDPVLLTPYCDINYHINNFADFARRLSGYTEKCIFSFFEPYAKAMRRLKPYGVMLPSDQEKEYIAGCLAQIARDYGIVLQSCAANYQEIGIAPARCIDPELICSISGKTPESKKDKYQRKSCGCVSSVDIGVYNTCQHECVYCYACFLPQKSNRELPLI